MENQDSYQFVVVGISHWNAPLDIREKYSISQERQQEVYSVAKEHRVEYLFVLSTCNRTQFFARVEDVDSLIEFFIKMTGTNEEMFHRYAFVRKDHEAVDHLFELCMGLDSMILGDLQIVHQVKASVKIAGKLDLIDFYMHRLMQYVLQCYKNVVTDTEINSGPASIAHAAVLYVKERIPDLSNKNMLLFGMGDIGETTLKNLYENYKTGPITIINRTRAKADKLAQRMNDLRVSDISDLSEEVKKADIVIVATGAEHATLKAEHLNGNIREKVLLDLSIPRNIDVSIGAMENVDLVEMDALTEIQDSTLSMRKKNIPKVRTIINLHRYEFYDWLKMRELSPVIMNLRNKLHGIRESEVQQQQFRLSANELQKADVLSKSVVNKIVNQTIEYLKSRYRNDEEIVDIVNGMFQLQDPKKIH